MSRKIKYDPQNFNKHTDDGMQLLEKAVKEVGVIESITIDKNDTIVSGNGRKEVFDKLGLQPKIIELAENEYPVIKTDLDGEKRTKAAIYANTVALKNINLDTVAIEEMGFDLEEVGVEVVGESDSSDIESVKLQDRFIVPPFSILDTKQGYWSERKKQWLSLGIKSELGRDAISNAMASTFKGSKQADNDVLNTGTSIFDPVLTEICYKWFNVDNGKILDPFAGGSVRGIVASKLGYEYLGNDLREEQILANRVNAKEVLKNQVNYPTWTTGDSRNIDKIGGGTKLIWFLVALLMLT